MIVFPEIKTMFDLYEKFKREQWNASELDYGSHGETGDITGDYGPTWIDLSKVPSLQGLLPEERSLFIAEHAWLALCTSIQGEDFAARTAASEAEEVPDRDARAALSMQTVDEVRHYEAGMRVLTHRYRDREFVYLRARDQRWKAFLARGYMEKLIGLHIVTEGLAMGRFKNREVHSPDPVIRDMYRRINVDEARHTALGMLYISHSIKEMPETERRQLEEFTFERILEDYRMYTDKMFDPDLCRRVGLDALTLTQEVRRLGLDDIVRVELNRRVMPKIKVLGLLPDRLLPQYRKHEFFVDSRIPPTAQMRPT